MRTSELYKGSLESLVLQLIGRQGEMYGYELTQRAKELSAGNLNITEGTLYPLLHKLESEGKLKSVVRPYGNRTRKYYSLTPEGKHAQAQASERIQAFIEQLQQFLNPKLA